LAVLGTAAASAGLAACSDGRNTRAAAGAAGVLTTGRQDPWHPDEQASRPRRIADDLAWLRQAYDEPEENGLRPLHDTAAVAAWAVDSSCRERLGRLRDRHVLDAAGFLMHEPGDVAVA